jgi:DNA mismatch repair protein MutS
MASTGYVWWKVVGTVRQFQSILFDRPGADADVGKIPEPEFFGDLNLDQVVDAVTAGREEYELEPFFYVTLRDVAAVRYRRERSSPGRG